MTRFARRWKEIGSAVAATAVVATGMGLSSATNADAKYGVSLPGPEYTLSMVLPVQDAEPLELEVETAEWTELARGEASFYGAGFAGRPTASGETFNPSAMTAAHPTLPFGTELRVTNQANGKQVIVRVNDRGPFAKDRIIDLSEAAAREIGMISSGTASVVLEVL